MTRGVAAPGGWWRGGRCRQSGPAPSPPAAPVPHHCPAGSSSQKTLPHGRGRGHTRTCRPAPRPGAVAAGRQEPGEPDGHEPDRAQDVQHGRAQHARLEALCAAYGRPKPVDRELSGVQRPFAHGCPVAVHACTDGGERGGSVGRVAGKVCVCGGGAGGGAGREKGGAGAAVAGGRGRGRRQLQYAKQSPPTPLACRGGCTAVVSTGTTFRCSCTHQTTVRASCPKVQATAMPAVQRSQGGRFVMVEVCGPDEAALRKRPPSGT